MLKWTGIVLGSIIILLSIAIAVVLNFIFTPAKLTPMVENIAQEYIATDIDIKGIELTFFSTFPDFSVKIDTLVITQLNDTIAPLLYTEHCLASINPMALLDNRLIVNGVTLDGANINLYVDSLIGPLKVFKLPSDTTVADTTAQSQAYEISLDKIELRNSSITIDDRRNEFYTKLDSMSLDLSAWLGSGVIDFDMELDLPNIEAIHNGKRVARNESVTVKAQMNYVHDSLKLIISQAELLVNSIELKAEGVLSADSTHEKLDVDLFTTLSTPSISEFLKFIPPTIIDNKKALTTQGVVDLAIEIKGEYSQESKPLITAKMEIEGAKAKYENKKESIDRIDCTADIYIDLNTPRNSYTAIDNFQMKAAKIIDLTLSGRVTNMLIDPFMDLNIASNINLTRFNEIFPLQEGLEFEGENQSNLSVQMALSDLTSSNFGQFYINGESAFNDMTIAIDGETFTGDSTSTGSLYLDIKQGKLLFGDKVREDNNSRTLLSTINLSELELKDKEGQFIIINDLFMTAGANFDNKTKSVNGVGVALDAQTIDMGIEQQLDMVMGKTSAKFTISPKNEIHNTKITGSFSSDSINAYEYLNNSEVTLSKADIDLTLVKQKERLWDRVGTVGFSKFSLVSDLFPLDMTLARSNIEVDNNVITLKNALISIGESTIFATGSVTNLIHSLFFAQEGRGQQKITIESKLAIRSRSINLTELIEAVNQSVLLSDSTLSDEETSTDITTDILAQNNIPIPRPRENENPQRDDRVQGENNKDSRGSQNAPRDSTSRVRIERRERKDSTTRRGERMQPQAEGSMLLVPRYIKFDLDLNLAQVIYEGGTIDSVKGKATIDQGVISLDHLSLEAIGSQANSSMVYQNINRNSSKLFLDMSFTEVDINRIGELLPAIDTLMPMMKSFEGSVDFDLRAAGVINNRVGFTPATLKAAMDISGRNLVLMDSETFTDLSKLLMFKNKDRNMIDSLQVSITADSARVDVLPFNVTIDRYKAIVGGTQVIDSSYNIEFDYNVSIMKSPLPFKAGVDIKGDLDDYEFDVTRAKLKKTDFVEQEKKFREFMESIK
ncbi:MAG: AsmA family protein [Rikenellaceae bacterium]